VPALLIDASGTICRANSTAIQLFGLALEGISPKLALVWSPENDLAADQFLGRWDRSPNPIVRLRFRVKGANTMAAQVAICSFNKDEQKYFILQLLSEAPPGQNGESTSAQKQKLECALQLARTVALDFNNALTSILGHTSLILGEIEPEHPWRGALLEVEKSAAKAAEIANDLGTFSRQAKDLHAQTPGNLNLVLQRTVEALQQSPRSAAVRWYLQLEPQLFAAKFDEARMQQAFLNVLENAVEALEGLKDAGRIALQTRNIELADPAQDRTVQLAPGAYVLVEVSDNGAGISPEVLPRIFEPFFTTKSGVHRGLGLAWVYGIITNHGGGVAVSSRPGSGTSFRLYLPAEKQVVSDHTASTRNLTGNQTVLVVDDEEILLKMGQRILSAYGYRVLTADNGERALEILGGTETVHLVITDLVMPTMSGRELVEPIPRVHPAMRILCTNGYVWPAGQVNDVPYLQKPYTTNELLLRVKQVLED
jgi:two-component system, cell cycle sensor histidine kinase and response regulator CckA